MYTFGMVSEMNSKEIHELVRQFYAAFETQDVEALKSVVSDDWRDVPPAAGQAPGPDGAAPVFALISTAFNDFKITVEDVFIDGNRVGVRAKMSGVHADSFMGITGNQVWFDIALHEFHDIEGGRIVKTYHLEDWFGFFMQVCSFPESPPNM